MPQTVESKGGKQVFKVHWMAANSEMFDSPEDAFPKDKYYNRGEMSSRHGIVL